MNKAYKILLLGNCQRGTYQKLLKARLPNSTIDTLVIHTLAEKQYQEKHDELSSYDLIISQLISSKFGPLSTESLKKSYPDKIVSILNIFFNGLHPDFGYINKNGIRIQSVIGDYHSKIAFDAYEKGFSVQKSLTLYNEETFYQYNYHLVWEQSITELKNRESSLDVSFAEELDQLSLEQHTMLSFNHPRTHVLNNYLTKILTHANIQSLHYDPFLVADSLLNDSILPIYDFVINKKSLPYSYSHWVKQPERLGGNYLTFEEFIEKSFLSYEKQAQGEQQTIPKKRENFSLKSYFKKIKK